MAKEIWAVGIVGNTVALQASVPGSNPGRSTKMPRDGEAVTRQAHNLKIGGSIPSPATNIPRWRSR